MLPPVESVIGGAMFLSALAFLLCFISCVQWFRFRHCAYNTDTGFWVLVILGFAFMGAGFGAGGVLHSLPLVPYTAKCLVLVGHLMLLTGLLRLFSWSSHRHTDSS